MGSTVLVLALCDLGQDPSDLLLWWMREVDHTSSEESPSEYSMTWPQPSIYHDNTEYEFQHHPHCYPLPPLFKQLFKGHTDGKGGQSSAPILLFLAGDLIWQVVFSKDSCKRSLTPLALLIMWFWHSSHFSHQELETLLLPSESAWVYDIGKNDVIWLLRLSHKRWCSK